VPLQFSDQLPPLPPTDLIHRVITSFDASDIPKVRESFDWHAQEQIRGLERALAVLGREIADFDRLLDFGCGVGRYLRHFGPLSDQMEIVGVDVDAEMIDWLVKNMPFGTYVAGPDEPPLPFEDEYFDLVLNHSVFTHLDERMQDLWLRELQRITRPGAALLLTVESLSTWHRVLHYIEEETPGASAEYRKSMETHGIVHIADDAYVGSTHPEYYHSTYHAPWYVFEHWTHWFDLVAYIPTGSDSQDMILMQRRAAEESRPALITPLWNAPRHSSPGPVKRWLPMSVKTVLRRVTGKDVRQLEQRAHEQDRALTMLQVGLHENNRRMSVIAQQLRDEIQAVRDPSSDSSS
jgi:SAM-dependent methyltransferase